MTGASVFAEAAAGVRGQRGEGDDEKALHPPAIGIAAAGLRTWV